MVSRWLKAVTMTTGARPSAMISSAADSPSRRGIATSMNTTSGRHSRVGRQPPARRTPGPRPRTRTPPALDEVHPDQRLVLGDQHGHRCKRARGHVASLGRGAPAANLGDAPRYPNRQRKRSQTPSSVGSNPTRGTRERRPSLLASAERVHRVERSDHPGHQPRRRSRPLPTGETAGACNTHIAGSPRTLVADSPRKSRVGVSRIHRAVIGRVHAGRGPTLGPTEEAPMSRIRSRAAIAALAQPSRSSPPSPAADRPQTGRRTGRGTGPRRRRQPRGRQRHHDGRGGQRDRHRRGRRHPGQLAGGGPRYSTAELPR